MDEKTTPTLGRFLQAAREAKKLSLRAVEKATGVSNAYLSQLESAKIKQPSPTILHKLSELYDITYNELLILAGYPVPSEDTGSSPHQFDRFGDLTKDEEQELIDYLVFLRAKRGRRE